MVSWHGHTNTHNKLSSLYLFSRSFARGKSRRKAFFCVFFIFSSFLTNVRLESCELFCFLPLLQIKKGKEISTIESQRNITQYTGFFPNTKNKRIAVRKSATGTDAAPVSIPSATDSANKPIPFKKAPATRSDSLIAVGVKDGIKSVNDVKIPIIKQGENNGTIKSEYNAEKG